MFNETHLIGPLAAMALLVLVVGIRLFSVRVSEMRQKRVRPQAVATSLQMTAALERVQAADNFKNLFELPVLFYVLCICALTLSFTPGWLIGGLWGFVGLRYLHSFIHCTYNNVMHRFWAYAASFLLLFALWGGFLLSVYTIR